MVPVFLGVLLTSILAALSIGFVPGFIQDSLGPTETTLRHVGAVVLQVFVTVFAIVASALVGFALAQPLSGPALEAIVRRQEATLGAPARPKTSFIVDIGRSLQSLGVSYAVGIPVIVLLFGLSFVVPYAALVLFPLKLVVAAFTIAWDMCDYPLAVRGLPVGRRVEIIFRHRGAVLGFSLALAAAALVPCLLLLLLPGGVAGAAQLMWHVERYERAHGRNMDGIRLAPGE